MDNFKDTDIRYINVNHDNVTIVIKESCNILYFRKSELKAMLEAIVEKTKIDNDTTSYDLIEKWKGRSYVCESQKEARLQCSITDALDDKDKEIEEVKESYQKLFKILT